MVNKDVIWYSEEETRRAATRPSPLLVRPVYQLHIIQCGTIITVPLKGLKLIYRFPDSTVQPDDRTVLKVYLLVAETTRTKKLSQSL